MKIIAFDMGTATGVAIGDSGGAPLCHTERLGKPGEPHGARFAQALRMTSRLIKQHQPELVALEMPIVTGVKGSQNRAFLSMGLRGCIMGMCHARGIRFTEYPVQSIRKHFIGQGNMKRREAKRATLNRCKLLGWHAATEDEADAAAVWDDARMHFTRTFTPPPTGLFEERAT